MSAEATVAAPLARRQPSVLAGLAATARPKQWTKNLILFGPLVFAYKLDNGKWTEADQPKWEETGGAVPGVAAKK